MRHWYLFTSSRICRCYGYKKMEVSRNARSKGKNKAQDSHRKFVSLQWMQQQDAWQILNTRIHNAMLARWQILKAAARSRNYKGPTNNAEISKDPEKARSAWIEWIASDHIHLVWLRVQMSTLFKKEKFHDLREVVDMVASARCPCL